MSGVRVRSRVRWWHRDGSVGCSWKVALADRDGQVLAVLEEGRKTWSAEPWDTPTGWKDWVRHWALRRVQQVLLSLVEDAVREANAVLLEYGDVKEGEE